MRIYKIVFREYTNSQRDCVADRSGEPQSKTKYKSVPQTILIMEHDLIYAQKWGEGIQEFCYLGELVGFSDYSDLKANVTKEPAE